MAFTQAQDKETQTTLQTFKGPNMTIDNKKNIVCRIDIVQDQNLTDGPNTHNVLDYVGFADPNADTEYDTAPIGSTYRYLTVASGAVTTAELYIKTDATTWTLVGAQT